MRNTIRQAIFSVTCCIIAIATTACTATPQSPSLTSSTQPAIVEAREIMQYCTLTNANAMEVAKILHDMGGVITAVDPRTNTVVIKGSPEDVKTSMALMDTLDRDSDAMNYRVLFIYFVKNAKAQTLATELNALAAQGAFDGHDYPPDPMPPIITDERINGLIIQVNKKMEPKIREVLNLLDRPLDK